MNYLSKETVGVQFVTLNLSLFSFKLSISRSALPDILNWDSYLQNYEF